MNVRTPVFACSGGSEPEHTGMSSGMVTCSHPAYFMARGHEKLPLAMKSIQCSSLQMHLLDFRLGFVHELSVITTLIPQLKSRCCIMLCRATTSIASSSFSSWWHSELSLSGFLVVPNSQPSSRLANRFLPRGNSHLHALSSHGRCTASSF